MQFPSHVSNHDELPAVIIYIDDILIFMKDEKGHDKTVMEVLHRLKENDLFVKPEKCFFKVQEVEMLRLIIGPDGIKMDPKKVEAIMAWPVPTKVKEVQSFLELANFYRHFVNNFSKVTKPLHELTCKDTEWKWTDKCQNAFKKLKNIFISQPVLSIVDTTNCCELSLTPLNMLWVQFSGCYKTTANGIPASIYQKGSMTWNVIMMCTIRK